MSKCIKFCCLLLLLTTCKKEFTTGNENSNPIYFPYGINEKSGSVPTHFIDTDGSLLIIYNGSKALIAVKIDSKGNLIFKKELLSNIECTFNSIVKKPDGSFLFLGESHNGIKWRTTIIKTDKDCHIMKILNWNPTPNDSLYTSWDIPNVFEDSADGYFMTPHVDFMGSIGSPYFIHINGKDSIDMDFQSALNVARGDILFSVYKNDNDIIALTNRHGSPDFYIQKINENLLYKKSYKLLSSKKLAIGINAKNSNNWVYTYLRNGNSVCLFDFDIEIINNIKTITALNYYSVNILSGAIVKKTYPISQNIVDYYTFINNIVIKDGFIYLPFYNSFDNYMVKLSIDGELKWLKKIGGNISRDHGIKLLAMGNELWFFGGGTLNQGKIFSTYLAKYDTEGELIKE